MVVVSTTRNNKFRTCIPLSVTSYEARVHDTNTIEAATDNIPANLKQRNIELFGDKWYMMKEDRKRALVANKGVTVITPPTLPKGKAARHLRRYGTVQEKIKRIKLGPRDKLKFLKSVKV